MEEEAIREKRRKKILERLQKESGNTDDSFEAIAEEDKQKTDGLSAHEKYLILKNSEKKEQNVKFYTSLLAIFFGILSNYFIISESFESGDNGMINSKVDNYLKKIQTMRELGVLFRSIIDDTCIFIFSTIIIASIMPYFVIPYSV